MKRGSNLDQHLHAEMLEPRILSGLKAPLTAHSTVNYLHSLIATTQQHHRGKTIILSHEMVFKDIEMLVALSNICRQHADDVSVIAYVRRQSDFLISSFGQWLFRSAERVAETSDVLRDHNIDPSLFWGVERHLIAAVLGGWHIGRQLSGHLYLDWAESISARVAALSSAGVLMSIGLLPRQDFSFPLIADFLTRAGLDPNLVRAEETLGNPAYHASMIEAVVNAIEAGYQMPGPHEANDFFEVTSWPEIAKLQEETQFIQLLKDHIDTLFYSNNARFASQFEFPSGYFEPRRRIDSEAFRAEVSRVSYVRASLPEEQRNRDRISRIALAQIAWAAWIYNNRSRASAP